MCGVQRSTDTCLTPEPGRSSIPTKFPICSLYSLSELLRPTTHTLKATQHTDEGNAGTLDELHKLIGLAERPDRHLLSRTRHGGRGQNCFHLVPVGRVSTHSVWGWHMHSSSSGFRKDSVWSITMTLREGTAQRPKHKERVWTAGQGAGRQSRKESCRGDLPWAGEMRVKIWSCFQQTHWNYSRYDWVELSLTLLLIIKQ